MPSRAGAPFPTPDPSSSSVTCSASCSRPAHSAIAVTADITHNAADCGLDVRQIGSTALGYRSHKTSLRGAFENAQHVIAHHIIAHHFLAHHMTTLFSGYSTIP